MLIKEGPASGVSNKKKEETRLEKKGHIMM
jgi:hypothetical protein